MTLPTSMHDQNLHVLHVIDGLAASGGGTSRAVADLTSHLSAVPHCQCSIFCKASPLPQVAHDPRVQVHHADRPIGRQSVRQQLETIHSNHSIDIIHTNGIWSPFIHFAVTFAKQNGVRLVATPHGMLEPWSLSQRKWKKRIAWWLYQKGDLKNADAIQVTATSEEATVHNLGLNNCIIVPNGVEVRPLPEQNEHQLKALFLSRVHPKKGIPILLNAWKQLGRADWELLIVGPGDPEYLQQIQQQIDSLFPTGQVKLLPAVSGTEKEKLYNSASIFVLPTHSENFGIVIAEALERELPVITTTGTPWTELDDVGCGWCIELSEENLLETLRKATDASTETLQKMGRIGRDHVREEFAWPAIAQNLFGHYQRILQTK